MNFTQSFNKTLESYKLREEDYEQIHNINLALDNSLKSAIDILFPKNNIKQYILDLGVSGSTSRGTQEGIPFDFDVAVVLTKDCPYYKNLTENLLSILRRKLFSEYEDQLIDFLSYFFQVSTRKLQIDIRPFEKRKGHKRLFIGKLEFFDESRQEEKFKIDVGLNPEEYRGASIKSSKQFNEEVDKLSQMDKDNLLANIRMLKHTLKKLNIYGKKIEGLTSTNSEKFILRNGKNLDKALCKLYNKAIVQDEKHQLILKSQEKVVQENSNDAYFNKTRLKNENLWPKFVVLSVCYYRLKKFDKEFNVDNLVTDVEKTMHKRIEIL